MIETSMDGQTFVGKKRPGLRGNDGEKQMRLLEETPNAKSRMADGGWRMADQDNASQDA